MAAPYEEALILVMKQRT